MTVGDEMAALSAGIDGLVSRRNAMRAKGEYDHADEVREQIRAIRVSRHPSLVYVVALDDSRQGGTWHWTLAPSACEKG